MDVYCVVQEAASELFLNDIFMFVYINFNSVDMYIVCFRLMILGDHLELSKCLDLIWSTNYSLIPFKAGQALPCPGIRCLMTYLIINQN